MNLQKLTKGWEILYKYTDGQVIKFKTSPVYTNRKVLDKRIDELFNMDMVMSITVREVKTWHKSDKEIELIQA